MKENLLSGQGMLLCNTISWSNHMNNALTWEISTSDELFIKKITYLTHEILPGYFTSGLMLILLSFITESGTEKCRFIQTFVKRWSASFSICFDWINSLYFWQRDPTLNRHIDLAFTAPHFHHPSQKPSALSFFFFSDNILSVLSWYIRHVLSIIQRDRI